MFRFVLWTVMFALCVGGVFALHVWNRPLATQPIFGVTFSTSYAAELGVDPQEVFVSLVEELGVRRVRLPVYWSHVEKEQGKFDFALLDRLVSYSLLHDVLLTIVVGAKVPRWPECYIPVWAQAMGDAQRYEYQHDFVKRVVQRYDSFPNVIRWQVENEPFFAFGDCPDTHVGRVFAEVQQVKSVSNKPIQMTSSGELGIWYDMASYADVLGISLYRETFHTWLGYFSYPLAPGLYRFRLAAVKPYFDTVIISELQAEPWFSGPIESRPLSQWNTLFGPSSFQKNVDFARKTGAEEVYLWGAEWWYVLKQHQLTGMWDVAKELF